MKFSFDTNWSRPSILLAILQQISALLHMPLRLEKACHLLTVKSKTPQLSQTIPYCFTFTETVSSYCFPCKRTDTRSPTPSYTRLLSSRLLFCIPVYSLRASMHVTEFTSKTTFLSQYSLSN